MSNRLRSRLVDGQTVCLACPTPIASPKIIELIGMIGFDGVWIDMEHQDFSEEQLFNMCLACRASGMDAIARIRTGPYWSYFRPLEAGAGGIMVPHCVSVDQVKMAVRNARFHPRGLRGLDGVEVAARYGLQPMADYIPSANRETVVMVQIEDCEAVECIESIMAVEGLDGVMIGPADLAQSYGGIPPLDQSIMADVVDRVSAAAAAEGKWWGIPVPDPGAAQKFHEKGARFFVCGAAIFLLKNEYSRIWQEFSALFRS